MKMKWKERCLLSDSDSYTCTHTHTHTHTRCSPPSFPQSFCKKHKVTTFPAVKVFYKGAVHVYEGARTVWSMQTFVEGLLNPAKKAAEKASALGAFDEDDDEDDEEEAGKKINKQEL